MAKQDFGFSEDGDLILGAPKYDSTGNLLYIYSDGAISVDSSRGAEDGRLVRDFTYSFGTSAYKQIIINRLKTDAPDWFHYPNMGGNLTDLIGEPNTRETGELGVSLITTVLTYNGLFGEKDISVRAVPINGEEIMFMITISDDNNQSYRLPLVFNLNHGIKEV
jgi:hypothetical protein